MDKISLETRMISEFKTISLSSLEMIQEFASFKTKIPKVNNFIDIVKEYSVNEVLVII